MTDPALARIARHAENGHHLPLTIRVHGGLIHGTTISAATWFDIHAGRLAATTFVTDNQHPFTQADRQAFTRVFADWARPAGRGPANFAADPSEEPGFLHLARVHEERLTGSDNPKEFGALLRVRISEVAAWTVSWGSPDVG